MMSTPAAPTALLTSSSASSTTGVSPGNKSPTAASATPTLPNRTRANGAQRTSPPIQRSQIPPQKRLEILALHSGGETNGAIARRLSVTRSSVQYTIEHEAEFLARNGESLAQHKRHLARLNNNSNNTGSSQTGTSNENTGASPTSINGAGVNSKQDDTTSESNAGSNGAISSIASNHGKVSAGTVPGPAGDGDNASPSSSASANQSSGQVSAGSRGSKSRKAVKVEVE